MQRGVLALNIVLIVASLGAAYLLNYGYGRAASINRVALGRSLTTVPADQEPGERVMNILLVGSDSSAGLDEADPIQNGRQGERLGDVIIVAHIDERSGGIALLSLPRDLWVEIGDTGRQSRINQAFLVGGPATLIETVEAEFDIPIHHYVNVDFAGFQGLVSAVGSVDVWFDTPARDWNVNARPEPRSQTGFLVDTAGCHSLDPETALSYVRSRYYQTRDADGRWVTDPTADLGRIRRQQDFLRRVIKRAIDLGARNPFVLRDLVDTGLENVAIDQQLTPQMLVDLGMAYRGFDPSQLQTYSLPAVDGQVGRNRVLLPVDDAAEPVLELFRGVPFDDPDTVQVTVRVGPDPEPAGPATTLRRAGFGVAVETVDDPPAGAVVVRYGPDGVHAAELVAAALARPVRLERVGDLPGRSVVVVVGADGGGGEPEGGEPGTRSPSPESNADPEADEPGPDGDPVPGGSGVDPGRSGAGFDDPVAEARAACA